ncbi:MAG: aminoacyl-tRNA hydrolase [Candidatus Eremiobacteraeota bacterium]|nr:aminoacyl-tRNA hydrolase [Candidatus Eremiobacteraeota bacterium]
MGNPGKEYERTRHNVGFTVIDEVARRFALEGWRKKDNALQMYDSRRKIVLVKPQSFMNLSGAPVRLIASWYRTPPENVFVTYDDMDIAFGKLRLRAFGGHGGHNGMRSLIATLGERFPRLRVGVGRPTRETIDHVLSPFDDSERTLLPRVVAGAADGIERYLEAGVEAAMQFVNTWMPDGSDVAAGKTPGAQGKDDDDPAERP